MKMKWVYGLLLLVFAFAGVYQNQSSVPNQQIVLQFEKNANHVDEAVLHITDQLQDVGASKIRVESIQNNGIVITYFSAADVIHIEKALQANGISSNRLPKPQDLPESYSFDISEIKASQDGSWGFEGTLVVESKEHLDRPVSLDTSTGLFANSDATSISVLLYNGVFGRNQTLGINTASYEFPEVRAGPIL